MKRVLTDNGSVPVPTVSELSDLPSSVTTAYVSEGGGHLWEKRAAGIWTPTAPTGTAINMTPTSLTAFSWVYSTTPNIRYTWGVDDAFFIDGIYLRVKRAGHYSVSGWTSFRATSNTDSYGVAHPTMIINIPANGYITGAAWVGSTTAVTTRAMAASNVNGSLVGVGSEYGGFSSPVYQFTSFINLELLQHT